jgi:MscS family membrane protein
MANFFNTQYYGNTTTQWLIAFAIILLAVLAARTIYWFSQRWLKALTGKTKSAIDDIVLDMLEEPLVLVLALLGFRIAFNTLQLPKWLVTGVEGVFNFLIPIIVAWLIIRLYDAFHSHYLVKLAQTSTADLDDQILPVLRTGVKTIGYALGVIIGLNNVGYDVTTVLAGLGLGGLAFALAARDTVANIFGGIIILIQRPFRAGDYIQFEGVPLIVREIGLRVTRLEHFDLGYSVFIPNEKFTSGIISNISTDPGHWALRYIKLSPETSAAQAKQAVQIIEQILHDHPDVTDQYLRLESIGSYALEFLVAYHVQSFSDRWRVITEVHLELLRQFEAQHIELAMPGWPALLDVVT